MSRKLLDEIDEIVSVSLPEDSAESGDKYVDDIDIDALLPSGRRKTRVSWSFSLISFILTVVIALSSVVAVHLNTAYATVSLNFPEITDGHNPDESPFDIYEVVSDEVLKRACEKLDNRIDVETLRKHLSVGGVTSSTNIDKIRQNVVDGNDKHTHFPSRYMITYATVSDSVAQSGLIPSVKALYRQMWLPGKKEVLEAVSEAYREYYHGRYCVPHNIFSNDWDHLKSLDYFNRASEFSNIIERMERYVSRHYEANMTFVSSDGTSYGDLAAELSRIVTADVEKYKSFIVQNGITNDKNKLLMQFEYVELQCNDNYRRKIAEHNIMLEGIELYDPFITKVVFIPALDADDKFYMNRTQIGVDYLTQKAERAKVAADAALSREEEYRYLSEQFSNAEKPTKSEFEQADKMTAEIIDKLDSFAVHALEVNDEFLKSVVFEDMTISGVEYGQGIATSVLSFVKTMLILGAFFYVLYCAIEFIKKMRDRKKRYSMEGGEADDY